MPISASFSEAHVPRRAKQMKGSITTSSSVSRESVFNPSLIGKPVAILSNNHGCVIARSDDFLIEDIAQSLVEQQRENERLLVPHINRPPQ